MHVNPQGVVPFLVGHFQYGLVWSNGHVANHDINFAEGTDASVYHFGDASGIGNVCKD